MRSLLLVLLCLAAPLSGQVTESRLRMLFGPPSHDVYTVGHGITVTASPAPGGEICVLSINGPASEDAVLKAFDLVVPFSARGRQGSTLGECTGGCQMVMDYERLVLIYATMGAQISKPAAMVESKTKACARQVKAAQQKGFSIARQPDQKLR